MLLSHYFQDATQYSEKGFEGLLGYKCTVLAELNMVTADEK